MTYLKWFDVVIVPFENKDAIVWNQCVPLLLMAQATPYVQVNCTVLFRSTCVQCFPFYSLEPRILLRWAFSPFFKSPVFPNMAVMAPGPYREVWQRAPDAQQEPGKTSEWMSRLLCPRPAWAGSGWEASPVARPSERLPWQTKRGAPGFVRDSESLRVPPGGRRGQPLGHGEGHARSESC